MTVAILAQVAAPKESGRGIPGDASDRQTRYLEAETNGLTVASEYLPNGNPVPSPNFDYKLAWFERFIRYAQTLKHTPAYPRLPFADFASATRGVARFVEWYNGTHRHSVIRYVTPDQQHYGRERAVLASRHELYERVRRANPERWSGSTRNWLLIELVVLNPERAPDQGCGMTDATTTLTLTGHSSCY